MYVCMCICTLKIDYTIFSCNTYTYLHPLILNRIPLSTYIYIYLLYLNIIDGCYPKVVVCAIYCMIPLNQQTNSTVNDSNCGSNWLFIAILMQSYVCFFYNGGKCLEVHPLNTSVSEKTVVCCYPMQGFATCMRERV